VHRGGKDTVGHVQGAHDDLANVIAGLIFVLTSGKGPLPLMDVRGLLRNGEPFRAPRLEEAWGTLH
jgi:hypothetical protein